MGLFSVKKDKNGNLACTFMHVDGIQGFGNYEYPAAVWVTQEDSSKRLSIKMRMSKVPPKYLPYGQIVSIGTASEKEIVEQSKSVVGRAAVGGLVFGPLGAVIGGISGAGKKQETKNRFFFVINYHPANSQDDIKVLSFEIVGASLHWSKFIDSLKSKIPQQPEKPVSQYL